MANERRLEIQVIKGRAAQILRLTVPWMTSLMCMLALHVEGLFQRCTLATIEYMSLLINSLYTNESWVMAISTQQSSPLQLNYFIWLYSLCPKRLCYLLWSLWPQIFEQYHVPLTKQTWIPTKSHTKPFKMSTTSNNLKMAIFNWQCQHAIEKFRNLVVHRLGAKLIISDEIIKCLIACAHSQTWLSTIEHLIMKTK